MMCPRCSAALQGSALYCSHCGAAVASQLASQPSRTVGDRAIERRQVTVVFYDLVDSTRLAEGSDPEEFVETIAAFHQRVQHAMESLGGFVGSRAGDGAIVYFGYPQAQESAAECAVQAALRAVQAAAELVLPGGGGAAARAGVATGAVIVSQLEDGRRGNEVVGAVAHLAARLQGLAPAGGVVISEATRRLIGELFEVEDLGPVSARGFRQRINAYRVLSASGSDRFEALHAARLSPLVGRDAELDRLRGAWRDVLGRDGQFVLIQGDPGIGKSRLAAALAAEADAADAIVLRYYCAAHSQNAPLQPVVEQFERGLAKARAAGQTDSVAALSAVLAAGTEEEDGALLGALLGLPIGPSSPLARLAPGQRLERTLSALRHQVELTAERRPVLVIFEDLHWADATSLDLLERTVRGRALPNCLVVLTARPEFSPPWLAEPTLGRIDLAPLGPREAAALVDGVASGGALPAAVRRTILERADGVPLFIEQLTSAVAESGGDRGRGEGHAAIPESLQDTLLARLDRVGLGKRFAQVGAVIGREFSLELLQRLTGEDPASLRLGLDQLVRAGLVFSRGGGGPTYLFRHALIQEAAYETLLRAERRRLNAMLVAALEQDFPELVQRQPERLARYAAEADLTESAAQYWLKAGLQALMQSAMSEAISRLRSGLALVDSLPAGEIRWRLELDLEIALGKALIATVGYAPLATGAAFARADDLCHRLGEPPQWLTVLHGQWTHELLRGRLPRARERADRLLTLAEARADPVWRLMGARFRGVTAFPLGEFDLARSHLRRGLQLYDPGLREAYGRITVDDGRVVMLTYLAWAMTYLGRPEEGLKHQEQALQEALDLAHPYSIAHALNGLGFVLLLNGAFDAAAAQLDRLAALTADHGIRYFAAVGAALHARCLWGLGRRSEGTAALRRAIEEYRETDSVLYMPTFLTWLAQAVGDSGATAEALVLTQSALDLIEQTDMRFDESTTLLTRADLLFASGDEPAAHATLQHAAAVARSQGAELVAHRIREREARWGAGRLLHTHS